MQYIPQQTIVTNKNMNPAWVSVNEQTGNKVPAIYGEMVFPPQLLYQNVTGDASLIHSPLITPSPQFPSPEFPSPEYPPSNDNIYSSPSEIFVDDNTSDTFTKYNNISMRQLYQSQCDLIADTLSQCIQFSFLSYSNKGLQNCDGYNSKFICDTIAGFSVDYIWLNGTKYNQEEIEVLGIDEYPTNIGSYPTIKAKFNSKIYKNYAIKLKQQFKESGFIWFTRLQPRYIKAALIVNDKTALKKYLFEELKADYDIVKKYQDTKDDLSFIQNKNYSWIKYTIYGLKYFDNKYLSASNNNAPNSQSPRNESRNKLTVISENNENENGQILSVNANSDQKEAENVNELFEIQSKQQQQEQEQEQPQQKQISLMESIEKLNNMKSILDNLLYKTKEYKALSSTVDRLNTIFNDNPCYPIQSSLRDLEKVVEQKKNEAFPIEMLRSKNLKLSQQQGYLQNKLYHLQAHHQKLHWMREQQKVDFPQVIFVKDDNGNGMFIDENKFIQLLDQNRRDEKRINYLKTRIAAKQKKGNC